MVLFFTVISFYSGLGAAVLYLVLHYIYLSLRIATGYFAAIFVYRFSVSAYAVGKIFSLCLWFFSFVLLSRTVGAVPEASFCP